jgi:hypothetical protein
LYAFVIVAPDNNITNKIRIIPTISKGLLYYMDGLVT